jgi:hypothetical protein
MKKRGFLRRSVVAVLVSCALIATPVKADLGGNITQDLVGAGVSVAVALSGSVPLALVSGYLVKYISVYGVQGIKALIEMFKGYTPQTIGEINVYYVYLIHAKRNIYQTLINIRKAAEKRDRSEALVRELTEIEQMLSEQCATEEECRPTALDDTFINYQFLTIALDGQQTININEVLSVNEIKNTYQYLMMLYLDVMIVEQKLIHHQYTVLEKRIIAAFDELEDNPYMSQAEKEYQAQLIMNIGLRWKYMADLRRLVLAQAIEEPLRLLQEENQQLIDDIDDYRDRYKNRRKAL